MTDRCLACGGRHLDLIADLGDMPVRVGVLAENPVLAREMVRGRLVLGVCLACGHVQNLAFDPTLVDYDASYDNSLYFSPTFRRYADHLARRLVERFGLTGGRIVEIGSGSGDFLAALCEAGGNVGLGFDPSTAVADPAPDVTLVADYYRPDERLDGFDLLVCRHVLEHLDDPYALLASIAAADPNRHGVVYLEVPSAGFNFGPEGLWDCIYPHVSYFSSDSLQALVTRAGLRVLDVGSAYDGQFLYVEALVSGERPQMHTSDPSAHVALARKFVARRNTTIDRWRSHVGAESGDVVLWGAGAKGVTFANTIDPDGRLTIVDLNPRKWGQYLPGTAQQVVDPGTLRGREVGTVLVTNPIYMSEIRDHLATLGVRGRPITV